MYKKAFKIAWGIYSVLGLAALLIATLLPAETVLQNTPACYSIKQYGTPCFMCGSTRSFIKAAGGNFNEAMHFNRFAFIIFMALIANLVLITYYLATNYLTIKKLRS